MFTIANLGEIGVAGVDPAVLTPIDLLLLRNGAVWSLAGYNAAELDVWESMTRTPIATPGGVTILAPESAGVVRWTPTAASFTSGSYEARIRVSEDAGTTWEPSGVFRFSIGAGPFTAP